MDTPTRILTPWATGRGSSVLFQPWDNKHAFQMERAYVFGTVEERAEAARRFNASSSQFSDYLLYDASASFSSTGAFPDTQNAGLPSAAQFMTTDRQRVDLRWASMFRFRDLRGMSTPWFKIADVYDAIDFRTYDLGARIELRHIEAGEIIYELDLVAGGYQYNKTWEIWQDLWTPEEGLAALQLKYAKRQAKEAYRVLTDETLVSLSTTAYDTAGATQVEKDINTINNAITAMKSALYTATSASGIQTEEDIEGSEFYLVYNSLQAGNNYRVAKALQARLELPNDNQSVGYVTDPVIPVGSPDVPAGAAWYLVMPGRKNVWAQGLDLQVSEVLDPRVAGTSNEVIGQASYKGVRGDSRQVRKIATA